MTLNKKIYEAIKTGISKSFNFEIEDDNDDFKIKKSKLNSKSIDNWVYEQYQEKYKKLIQTKDFYICLDLYNSGYLNQKPRIIGYKVESKEELRKLVENFDSSQWDDFDLNWLDVSEITNMSSSFIYFNCNVSEWDVSNVTNMSGMFEGCYKFNQDLSRWDVSNVTNMSHMFWKCLIKEEYKPKFKD